MNKNNEGTIVSISTPKGSKTDHIIINKIENDQLFPAKKGTFLTNQENLPRPIESPKSPTKPIDPKKDKQIFKTGPENN